MATDLSSILGYGQANQLGSGTYGIDTPGTYATATDTGNTGLMAAFSNWLKTNNITASTDANGVKTDGVGSLALGAASGLGSLYMGLQQYQLAKDTLENNKNQFALNYAAQKSTTNASLADRQAARVASNPTAYQSVSDYMNQYGIK